MIINWRCPKCEMTLTSMITPEAIKENPQLAQKPTGRICEECGCLMKVAPLFPVSPWRRVMWIMGVLAVASVMLLCPWVWVKWTVGIFAGIFVIGYLILEVLL